jgi:hypothetical protein
MSYDGADAVTARKEGEPRQLRALDGSLRPPPVDIEDTLPCFFLVGQAAGAPLASMQSNASISHTEHFSPGLPVYLISS